MNVLLINGSPRHNCTYTALAEMQRIFEEAGIETQLLDIGDKEIRGCMGCLKCKELGHCVFDDIVNETAPLFKEADGVVIGSPVYVSGPNGTLISYLNRLFYSTHFDKRMKVGAAVVSARRNGTTATFEVLNQYFLGAGMPAVAIGNWNAVHGYTPEDVLADEEGLATLRVVAENMIFLMKSIALGKEEYGLPAPPVRVKTNYIR
jgi:multimeric flavodoxin WrbA